MFSRKKQPAIRSLIGAGTTITGKFSFEEGLRIDGAVKGDIEAGTDKGSMLVISEHATVEGSIRADHVVVNGTVHGPIHAAELLELQPKARIHGDVQYAALEMHQGAVIDGTLSPLKAGGAADAKPALVLAASNQ
jgi:cytoskeletal protein CcmA (bactofilin family)